MNLASLLHRTAASDPERPALALGPAAYRNYGALSRRAAVLAGGLERRFGLEPGARVALAMTNCPAFIELLYACWHAGLVVVPINAKLHPAEMRYILEHSGARLCFATAALATALAGRTGDLPNLLDVIACGAAGAPGAALGRLLESHPVAPATRMPEDPAWLFYTSGTTGRPKGAVLSQRNLLAMTLSYFVDVDSIAPDDCILHAAPLSHGSGLYNLPHMAAGALQVVPESGGFDPAEVLDLIARHRGVGLFAAPTMVKRLVEAPGAEPATLKTVVYGGGPMYLADLKRAMARFGDRFVQIYGQGESPMTITVLSRAEHMRRDHPHHEARLASVGRPHTVVEVRVADDRDRPLPPGETGEILVRGDSVMTGYWRDPEASARALRGGWLHTGDLGTFDADGFLTLMDRTKDVIISGGTNIYPREVEEVLQVHPAVRECAVVGRPHPDWGEEVVAFVVTRPDRTPAPEDLERLCLERIARFKRPRVWRFVETLPKNDAGKVLKTELRKQAVASDGPSRRDGT